MLIFVLRVLCLDTKRERRWIMAKIVVWGAGIGGMTAAYELRAYLGREHSVTVVGDGPRFSFTPSNPWVSVGWCKADDVVLEVGRQEHRLRRRGRYRDPRRAEPAGHARRQGAALR